jgi:hypothetical protein
MSKYITIDTPGGMILAEVEDSADTENLNLTSLGIVSNKSLEDAVEKLKETAKFAIKTMKDLSPNEVEISFGISIGAEAGIPFFALAKATGESSIVIKVNWKAP